ncbi:hypothetical protein D791_03152 [Nitrincola nitratireducens]|uniref:Uncharacterized protein n=3 Tax=Nitrincola TaxID=267849 RepID=W9URX6_9GAMM|nr:hypothetical protein D791_03152 [Nitrincola nitratireducens]
METFDKAMMDVPGVERFEQFTYPGRYKSKLLGEPLIRLRTEHNEALHDQVFGKSHCRSFRSGHQFELVRHDDAAQELDTYLLVSVQHRAEDYSYTSRDEESRGYENEFVCMPASRVYRPPLKTGWPKMLGPQHAKVVGPEGEEIYTDEYGRVKIQFPWDRYGQNNENSSCWVRVSHQWAGKNWGSIYIPRIGQEVIVDFYDGNPDRPIITGRVYNAEQMPPNSLPANKTRSTIRSKSHKGKGFNEFSFEDEAGNEFIYIHAQKNMEVQVQNSHHKRVEYDDTATIGNNSYLAVAQDRIEKVDQNQHTTIIGNLTEKIDGNQGVTLGGSQHSKVGGDMTYKVSGEIVLDASKITLVSGGASIVITSGGINIAPSINVGSASPGTAAIPSIPEILEVAAGAGSPFVSHCPKTT